MVGCVEDQRVVELTQLFQVVKDLTDLGVKPLDLLTVVEQIAPDEARVGQIGRHLDIGELATRAAARAFLVGAMGFVAPHPEAEGLTRLAGLEEIDEVAA